MALRLSFGLCPAGSREEQPGHQVLSDESDPTPGSRVGPRLRRTGRRHVARFSSPHEGVLNCSLSDPSPRACLPWETLRARSRIHSRLVDSPLQGNTETHWINNHART
ncbi:hypothetical protein AMECASPLE_037270 [Ameca splendens]|uniref:Uncharacterized protein n=1 Tax=Ameca splendens TaxID=208324 RepID=A0ABV0XL24_9TELE